MPAPDAVRTQFRATMEASDLVPAGEIGANALHGQLASWQLSPIVERVLEMDVGNPVPDRIGLGQLENVDLTLVARSDVIEMLRSFTGEVTIEIFNAELRDDLESNGARKYNRLHINATGNVRSLDFGQVGFNAEPADTYIMHVRELAISHRPSGAAGDTNIISFDVDVKTLTIGTVDVLSGLKTALGL